jgi:RHS repeat-associated protein
LDDPNITYIIGRNKIAQITVKNGTEQEYYFTFDGHGSTRVLTDLAGAIAELYAFDAYGNALGFDPSVALTEFLYSGEQFDSKIGQQYLRARYYDPATGRFNRLDPFFGNLDDPQSLHKYLYCHADPITMIDPSGLESLISVSISVSVGGSNQSRSNAANVSVYTRLARPINYIKEAIRDPKKLWDIIQKVDDLKDLLDLDPSDIAELKNLLPNDLLKRATDHVKPKGRFEVKLPAKIVDKIGNVFGPFKGLLFNTRLEFVSEWIGLLGMCLAAGTVGFEQTNVIPKYHGIDAVLWDPWLTRSVVMEAKGGNSSLGYTNKGRQMSDSWIKDKWERVYEQHAKRENDAGRPMSTVDDPMWAIVAKLNLKRKNTIFVIEFQTYPHIDDRWGRSLPKII